MLSYFSSSGEIIFFKVGRLELIVLDIGFLYKKVVRQNLINFKMRIAGHLKARNDIYESRGIVSKKLLTQYWTNDEELLS